MARQTSSPTFSTLCATNVVQEGIYQEYHYNYRKPNLGPAPRSFGFGFEDDVFTRLFQRIDLAQDQHERANNRENDGCYVKPMQTNGIREYEVRQSEENDTSK